MNELSMMIRMRLNNNENVKFLLFVFSLLRVFLIIYVYVIAFIILFSSIILLFCIYIDLHIFREMCDIIQSPNITVVFSYRALSVLICHLCINTGTHTSPWLINLSIFSSSTYFPIRTLNIRFSPPVVYTSRYE